MTRTFIRWVNAILIALLLLFLVLAWRSGAKSDTIQNVAIGDSVALGVGHALGVPTYAWTGASSCAILFRVPSAHFRNAVLSAGINDPPGLCFAALLASIHADRLVVILPAGINSARAHVADLAQGFPHVSYKCAGPCTTVNYHPRSYPELAQQVKALWE